MKKCNFILFSLCLLFFTNCKNDNSQNVEKDAATLGNLQCQAQELRNNRFHLADEMRFADDSVRLFHKKINPDKEHEFDSLKIVLAAQTDQMSKKINRHLDSLWKNGYPDEAQRKKLDAAVIAFMSKNCPEK